MIVQISLIYLQLEDKLNDMMSEDVCTSKVMIISVVINMDFSPHLITSMIECNHAHLSLSQR